MLYVVTSYKPVAFTDPGCFRRRIKDTHHNFHQDLNCKSVQIKLVLLLLTLPTVATHLPLLLSLLLPQSLLAQLSSESSNNTRAATLYTNVLQFWHNSKDPL